MVPSQYLNVIVGICLLNVIDAYILVPATHEYILDWTENYNTNQFTLDLKENNHDGAEASHLLLFTLDLDNEAGETFSKWDFADQSFSLDSQSVNASFYEFYTNQYMDYEQETAHSYQLSTLVGSSFIMITVTTINIDDEPPTLTATMCDMLENYNYTEANTSCTATLSDPDGWLGNTTFTIINSNPNADSYLEKEDELFVFSFDNEIAANIYNTTVYLTTLQTLDYETKIFYSFSVQAQDGAGHATTPNANVTCIVDVGDVNDMPPEWTDYFTTMQIVEKTAYTFNVTAVDGDRGINAAINYSIIAFDDDGDYCQGSCVSVERHDKRGVITVKPIDRDTKDLTTYKFDIMAQEEDDPPFTVNLTITFFLEDLDDHSPVFISVTPSNDTTTDVENEDSKFVEFTFFENYAGSLDGNIWIQDLDTGENAQFGVELLDDDENEYPDVSYIDAFLVVPTAGYRSGNFTINVKNATYLDFENEPWQNFTFYIHSWGTLNSSNEDYLLVNINLLDYNDELPIFANDSYVTSVEENIHHGEDIITVKATDRDAEDKVLTHKLVGASTIIDVMSIDSAEGTISVSGEDYVFDYDRINPVIFQVQAIDKVNHATTVSVTINLIDVNNKAPTYKVGDIIQVEENQDIGIALNATITASDVDTERNLWAGINWDSSYAMKNSQKLPNTTANIKAMQFLDLNFQNISEDTISIELVVNGNNEENTAPDYETFDTLYLSINITDLNTLVPEFEDQKTIEALIIVNIIDINDNAPIFTNETIAKNRTVYEKSPSGTIAGTIEATDADVGDVVSYSCTYVEDNPDWFECDEYGQITAKTSDIDADTGPVYNVSINCTATDGYWNTSQVFDIYILDTNDQFPQIKVNDTLPSTQMVDVEEKSPNQTYVTHIGAFDADRDIPFHTVRCRLSQDEECYDSFEIDENNDVRVKIGGNDIDRDTKKANYTCTPICYDNPNNERNAESNMNSTATFTIKLLDINDHCPEMLTSELDTNENIAEGESIGKVEAEDLDEGLNAEIVMEIVTVTKIEDDGEVDYTEDGLFVTMKDDDDYYINATRKQWHIIANRTLKDYYGQYIVQLRLSDEGRPPNTTDDDGNEALKEKAKLTLNVQKYNYYAPKFLFPNESKTSFALSTDQQAGEQLAMYYNNETFGNIEIQDGDNNEICLDKWDPKFDVSLVNAGSIVNNFFVIEKTDRCTAQLQVDDSYNKDDAINIASYKLRLSVTLENDKEPSEGEASFNTTLDITLNFVDLDEDPVFNQTLGQWNISFREADASQTEILPEDRKAFYANLDDSSDMPKYYFLSSTDEDVQEMFEIDVNTGTIKLRKELDYLVKTYYTFDVLAGKNQSIGSDKSASKMAVNVTVIDINNHVPQWTEMSFFGAVLTSSQKGSIVVTIEATDLDTIDQGNLVYSMNSTISAIGSDSISRIQDAFLLNEVTGNVTLNFQVESNMNGYFTFWVKVQDHEDIYGNGPFENTTIVTISIVTGDNTVTFKFENTLDTVVEKKSLILQTISEALDWSCHDQNVDNYSEDGVTFDNVTAANIYCVENTTVKEDEETMVTQNLLTADDMKTKLNNIDTYQKLKQNLLNYGILLQTFQSDATAVDKLQNTLKVALIGVSAVLGALCVILGVTFFFKIRELNNRLKKLTQQEFGSDESKINRTGLENIPTSNEFAAEGTNPIFNIQMDRDATRDDTSSIHSGNSDLIGIEDNPEFDEIFGRERF